MQTTKIYSNTSDADINVIGIGVIPTGEQVSITTEFQPAVVLENYPGLVDVTAADYSVDEDTDTGEDTETEGDS